MAAVTLPEGREALARLLARNGFLAAAEEADALLAAAGGDDALLERLVSRRLTGEPLAWVTGEARFCGVRVRVAPGVYPPRWPTEIIAQRALERLPAGGVAVDVCTGSGAVALALMAGRPDAHVVACDIDERSVACARSNGVEAYLGDLLEPVPAALRGRVDVVAGSVPYVPTAALATLHRDTFTFESTLAYDGGADGLEVLRRVLADSGRLLRRNGAVVLELGGEQAQRVQELAPELGYVDVGVLRDADGDPRGVEATFSP